MLDEINAIMKQVGVGAKGVTPAAASFSKRVCEQEAKVLLQS